MKPKIIALCGRKGSGKTTLAKQLSGLGYKNFKLADPLKSMLDNLLAYQGVDEFTRHRMLEGDLKEVPSIYLENQTPRYAMQTLGTEWRDLISKDLWLNILVRRLNKDHFYVIDDLRFKHEAEKIKSLDGIIVLVKRNFFYKEDNHASEVELFEIFPSITIFNNSTPEQMLISLNTMLGRKLCV